MADRYVRVTARGVVRRGDELLAARDSDSDGSDSFYYLPGGGVEFGEHSEEGLRREFREELSVSLESMSYRATYEDVFTFDGRTEHEVMRVYDADITESWPYERDSFAGYEPDLDERIDFHWKSVGDFRDRGETFYPEPLLADL